MKYKGGGCRVTTDSTTIKCASSAGVGVNLQWCLRVGGQWADAWCADYDEGTMPGLSNHAIEGEPANATGSYALPTITRVEGAAYQTNTSSFRGRGGEPFDVEGENFGPVGTIVRLFYGPSTNAFSAHRYEATNCAVKVAHEKIRCVSVSGVGFGHVQYVVAGGQESSSYSDSHLINYRPPSIISVTGAGSIASTTAGGTTIVITGNDFGPPFVTVNVPCSYENSIRTTDMTDYDAADLVSMYAKGTPNKEAIEGETYQAECCRVESDQRIVCKKARGTGVGKNWHVRVGNQWSNVNDAGTSYGRPVIIDYEISQTGGTAPANTRSYNTSGGESIVIVGKNFGFLISKVENISYGMVTSSEFHIDPATCDIVEPHTKLRCPLVEGAGYSMSWRVVVDGQASAYPTSAYGIPNIERFELHRDEIARFPGTNHTLLNSHGSQKIIIHGTNFGPKTEFITEVTYGPLGRVYRATNCTIIVKSTQILCLTAPGIGLDHKWIISIRGQVNEFHPTLEPTTSYMRPSIIQVNPRVGPTSGLIEIELVGYHFGAVDKENLPGVSVFLGTYSKESLGCTEFQVRRGRRNPEVPDPNSLQNEETITFLLPEFHSSGHPIKVGVGANTCPSAACVKCPSALYVESDPVEDGLTFDYLKPRIDLIQIRSFPGSMKNPRTDQQDLILILEGENFCRGPTCGRVWVGPYDPSRQTLTRDGTESEVSVACPQYGHLVNGTLCGYAHDRISFIVPLPNGKFGESGTVWVEAGLKNVLDPLPGVFIPSTCSNDPAFANDKDGCTGTFKASECKTSGGLSLADNGEGLAANEFACKISQIQYTDDGAHPPKSYQFVSPQISQSNKTSLGALVFDTAGNCEVTIEGKYFGDNGENGDTSAQDQLCVTVGQCIPKQRWNECGKDCTLADGTVVGKSTKVYDLTPSINEVNSFKFKVPVWQGQFQDFYVWRDDQASVNDYIPGSNTVREVTISYKRPSGFEFDDKGGYGYGGYGDGGNDGSEGNCQAEMDYGPDAITGDDTMVCSPDKYCQLETASGGSVCVTPKCYSEALSVLVKANTNDEMQHSILQEHPTCENRGGCGDSFCKSSDGNNVIKPVDGCEFGDLLYKANGEPLLEEPLSKERVYSIPASGARVTIKSQQLGSHPANNSLAPLNSYIVFGAFYKEATLGGLSYMDPPRCLENYDCNWLLPENRGKPKCGCEYPDLSRARTDLWTNPGDSMTEGKTWTDTAISNIWIPPGTGKGYKLQVIVNGVPSRPIRINYDAPRISKIVDESGAKLPSKGGTAGGMLLTFTGANFGCLPTEGTIGRLSDKDGAADGMLSQQELAKYYAIGSVYDSASSTGEQFFEWKDDILVRVEDSDSIYDAETIRTVGDVIYAYDANKDGIINRMEYVAWEQAKGSFEHPRSMALNLCQGAPRIRFYNNFTKEEFPCPVIALAQNELTCNVTAGEGQKLEARLVPAGGLWTIGEDTGLNVDSDGASIRLSMEQTDPAYPIKPSPDETAYPIPVVLKNAFSYNVPIVTSATTHIPGVDCSALGHACGPSSAVVRYSNVSEMAKAMGNFTRTSSDGLSPVLLTIHGSNFGRDGDVGANITVELVCDTTAEHCGKPGTSLKLDASTMIREQNRIRVYLSPGVGKNLRVKVTVSEQSNDAKTRFSFLEPRITAVLPYSSDKVLALGIVTEQDRKDGKFFQRRFEEADVSDKNGELTVEEFRQLLRSSEPFRVVVDLTARDAERIFDEIDFNRDSVLSEMEFLSLAFSSTDGCEKGAFESVSQWQDRINKVPDAQVGAAAASPDNRRKCLKPRTMIFFGENLGPVLAADGGFWDLFNSRGQSHIHSPWTQSVPSSTRIWVGSCASFDQNMCLEFKKRCTWESSVCKPNDVNRPGAFDVYDVNILDFDGSERTEKCAELSMYDKREQSWLVTCSPIGLGANHAVFVNVSGRVVSSEMASVSWSYAKPSMSSSLPRPYNAAGEQIIIQGQNLGGVTSPVSVNMSSSSDISVSLPCQEAKWFESNDLDGRPYVTCRTQRDVVGSKSVQMAVALQTSAPADALKETLLADNQLSRFHSVCKNGPPNPQTGVERAFYAKPGQLCALCPPGALCVRESYAQPIAVDGFWRDELDLTEGGADLAQQDEPANDDPLGKRGLDDMKRALGASDASGVSVRFPGCAPERILRIWGKANETDGVSLEDRVEAREEAEKLYERYGSADDSGNGGDLSRMNSRDAVTLSQSLKKGFPHAIPDDRCFNFQGCQPKEACTAGNTCSKAYRHTQRVCNEIQDTQEFGLIKPCQLSLQCYGRTEGPTCMRAIPYICDCPDDWEAGSFACQKNCLRDPRKQKLLSEAKCNLELLNKGLARQPPLYVHAINGARCKFDPNATRRTENVLKQLGNQTTGMPNDPATGGKVSLYNYMQKMQGACECVPSSRCALCTKHKEEGYYRVSGECIPCPQNPEMIIAAAICGLVFICVAMRELDKRNFNLAFVSIGWDYFQVLALFADADIRWPPVLKALFRMLSFFNIDIDVVAPECLVPDMKYSTKYLISMMLPVGVAVVLFLSWVGSIFFHRICLNRKVSSRNAKVMASKLISSYLLGMYFMYLMISRRALEIFNCNPVDPDDGFTYTQFTSVDCDGGLCRCWDPAHVQVRLVPWSVLALIVMTLGFPIFVFILLRTKKNAIKEDQYLRALDIAPNENTNPVAFYNRLKYHKMYYHFKPGKVYWIVFIIARKGFISAAGLLFRANPGFQLAFVLLVLFWAYTMQVKNQPFMSSVERKVVILEHQAKVEDGDGLHVMLETRIKIAEKQLEADSVRKKIRRSKTKGGRGSKAARKQLKSKRKSGLAGIMERASSNIERPKNQRMNYYWNYNTVERVLLSCLIVVCVCGVMFESDRFQDANARPPADGFGAWVRFQQDIVTFMCIFVIFGSMFFYFCVAYSEVVGTTPNWVKKVLCLQKKLDIHGDVRRNKSIEGEMEYSENPYMTKLRSKEMTREMEEKMAAIEALAAREKKRAAQAIKAAQRGAGRRAKRGTKVQKAKKKAGFGARQLRNSMQDMIEEAAKENGDEIGIEMMVQNAGVSSGVSSTHADTLMHIAESSDPDVNSTKPAISGHQSRDSYFKHETDDGLHYFEHAETGETQWVLPEDAEVVDIDATGIADGEQTNYSPRTKRRQTVGIVDGSKYYEDENGNTTWEKVVYY
jgi:hypothetical protein